MYPLIQNSIFNNCKIVFICCEYAASFAVIKVDHIYYDKIQIRRTAFGGLFIDCQHRGNEWESNKWNNKANKLGQFAVGMQRAKTKYKKKLQIHPSLVAICDV